MMQGSEFDWPMPTGTREAETPREAALRFLPAILVTLALHGVLAWKLLELRTTAFTVTEHPEAIEIVFLEPKPRHEPVVTEAPPTPEVDADAVPFPATRSNPETAQPAPREVPIQSQVELRTEVTSSDLFETMSGVAAEIAGQEHQADGRIRTAPLAGRDQPFLDTDNLLKPPPKSIEDRAIMVVSNMMSTRGSNAITDFMGIKEGRDPGREMQRAHHEGLYLPRGCDDPDKPNLSDECLGIPRR